MWWVNIHAPGRSSVAESREERLFTVTALVEAWQRQDRDLASGLHAAAGLLHRSAEVYRATDDANQGRLARVAPAQGAPPA